MTLKFAFTLSFLGVTWLTLAGPGPLSGLKPAHAAESMKCPDVLLKGGQGRVPLFSAIPLRDTPMARSWSQLIATARQEFPSLHFEGPDDLHITLVYLGTGWPPEKLEEISRLALVGPADGSWHSAARPEVFGKNGQVVVLKLDPAPQEWTDRLVAAKSRLNELGLKKPDSFDTAFNAHVTLARSLKPAEEAAEMQRFQKWITDAASRTPELQSLTLTPKEKPALLLSYQPGPDSPKYAPLLEFCSQAALCPLKFSEFR